MTEEQKVDFADSAGGGVFLSPDKKESWLQTGSGSRVSVAKPLPEEIKIEDVSGAISKLCRYSGHCNDFYSVAQHSVLGAKFALQHINVDVAKEFLMHDATEAYVGDLIRPVKVAIPEFSVVENKFWRAIAKKFNLGLEHTQECHYIDNVMIAWEKRDLLPNSEEWPNLPDITGFNLPTIKCWSWKRSETEYNRLYAKLFA